MGTGGITVIVVQVENRKTTYVIIDGNNMIPGLREKLLSALGLLVLMKAKFSPPTPMRSAL